MRFGWVKMSVYNVVCRGPKFRQFFLLNAELIVFDNAVYPLSISLSILKIFAVKLESCRKSNQFLNVFCPPKF